MGKRLYHFYFNGDILMANNTNQLHWLWCFYTKSSRALYWVGFRTTKAELLGYSSENGFLYILTGEAFIRVGKIKYLTLNLDKRPPKSIR